MKLRQKQPNPKREKRHGVNLTAMAAAGMRRIEDRSGQRYVFRINGQMVRVEGEKQA